MNQLELLDQAAKGVQWTHRGVPGDVPYGAILEDGTLSFSDDGFLAVSLLARNLHQNRSRLRRGAKFERLRRIVAQSVVELFGQAVREESVEARETDLKSLKRRVEKWFEDESLSPRRHVVPCAVIPGGAKPFRVGPVKFIHVADLEPAELELSGSDLMFKTLWEQLFVRQMSAQAAEWVAVVEIDGCEKQRSREMADVVVDIALGGLQVLFDPEDTRYMVRTTSRANPPFRGGLVVHGGRVESNVRNMEAGRTLLPEVFESIIEASEQGLESIGRRLAAFLGGGSPVSRLEQAWCDAAYWFHEGIAEPLDTVAIAKLETAMEALFAAGSTTGSKGRVSKALRVMFGDGAQASARRDEEFAEAVVRARSKILHGTWSTTAMEDVGIDRVSVEKAARGLILYYSVLLDEYQESVKVAADSAASFLAWIEKKSSAAGGER